MTGGPVTIDMQTRDTGETQHNDVEPPAQVFETFLPEDPYIMSEDEHRPVGWQLAAPYLLGGVALIWVAGLLWIASDTIDAMSPLAIAQFAAALVSLPALAGIVWLITLRTSRAEAQRFGASARAMRAEAAALERSVAALAAALETNRERLADQIRQLSSIGDAATAKLASVGRGLSEEIDQADVHARSLAEAAANAQANLTNFLTTMPRVQAEVEGMAERIDLAALAAGEHTAALDAQVIALAERAREAEAAAGGSAQALAAHIDRMEATSVGAGTRLQSTTSDMAAAVDALIERLAGAVDAARKGIAAQSEAAVALVGTTQATLDASARTSADALADRITAIEQVIDRIAERLDGQRAAGDGLIQGLEGGLTRVESQLDALHQRGVERSQHLAASISALGGSADAMTQALAAGDAMANKAIATTESLLVALDAAAREIDETLPAAVDRLDSRVIAAKAVVVAAKPELLALVTAAESTHEAIEAIAQVISDQRQNVDTLTGTLIDALSNGRSKADAMGQMVDEAADRANRFAEEAAPRLLEALLRVRDTATQAAEHAREVLAKVIPEAAEALEKSGTAALQRAVDAGLDRQIAQIETTAEEAVAAANRAAERLSQQLQGLDAAAAMVDTRLDVARKEIEDRQQESFARRASLLIDAMNSAAIDITRTFSPDVADSAWAAYLKGDRGVFTRRAVRLLDSVQQAEIGRFYDEDEAFRDQVNRYIHDFEAMLRTILAQPEGSLLAVTLLSSDMGKLYVALAQGIERLR